MSDDAELLERIRNGATDDFAELVRRHQSRVFAILHRYERDTHKVEDLAQEAFVKAWRALGQFDGRAPFEHWLSSITTRVALDHLRKEKRRQNEIGLPELGEDALDWLRSGDEKNELDARSAAELLELAMRELSPADRVVITMQELEGRSVKEIAAAIGASGVAVRVRAMRARSKLRRALEKIAPLLHLPHQRKNMNHRKLKQLFASARQETAPAPPEDFAADVLRAIRREPPVAAPETISIFDQLNLWFPRLALAASAVIVLCGGGLRTDGGGSAKFGRRRVAAFRTVAFDTDRTLIMKAFKLSLLVALVFLAGVAAGVVGTRIAIRHWVNTAIQRPENFQMLLERNLRWQLRLDARQRVEVHRILTDTRVQLRDLRKEYRPQVVAVLTNTEAQISAVLTPEQEAQFERMQQENRRFFPPPEPER